MAENDVDADLEALLEGTAEPVEGWAFAEGHVHNVESLAPR